MPDGPPCKCECGCPYDVDQDGNLCWCIENHCECMDKAEPRFPVGSDDEASLD